MLTPAQSAHLSDDVVAAASDWFVRLSAETPTPAEYDAWLEWLNAQPSHRQAWERIERLGQQFQLLDAAAGLRTLNKVPSRRRRNVLKSLAFMLTAGGSALLAQQLPLRSWAAKERTAVGERRQITLSDGSVLILNTDSAANIVYNKQQRAIELHQGEIHITTRPDSHDPARPFMVITPVGRIVALGTQFSVYLSADSAQVSVGQHKVRLEPAQAPQHSVILPAGMSSTLTAHSTTTATPVPEQHDAWLDGMLYADNMRLDDLITSLARYKPGFLSCDPAIGGLRISGAYPLNDIDRALNAIERILPVRIERRTAYWIRVTVA